MRRQIEYNALLCGAQVTVVDPAYTFQTCNRCGRVDAKSRRTRDQFTCTRCGHATPQTSAPRSTPKPADSSRPKPPAKHAWARTRGLMAKYRRTRPAPGPGGMPLRRSRGCPASARGAARYRRAGPHTRQSARRSRAQGRQRQGPDMPRPSSSYPASTTLSSAAVLALPTVTPESSADGGDGAGAARGLVPAVVRRSRRVPRGAVPAAPRSVQGWRRVRA
ncbi:zinc ribbon domain-containing protein [Streptomyces zaomyceticus]|uniref:zinc ribbon domain-containing protein n=1 Tax=Streptomyces zaomyceticus TaxID=68286 RepID=UPI003F4D9DB8